MAKGVVPPGTGAGTGDSARFLTATLALQRPPYRSAGCTLNDMRRLSSQQIAEVALEALANARRLYDDAVHLRQADRLPGAFMVAGLAADELGKHVLVTAFYGARENTDEEWRKFWRRFRRHESKLGDALLGAWLGDLFTEAAPPDVAAFHQERLLATYVDVGADGTVTVPLRHVAKARVDDILSLIEHELDFCESVMAQATPTKLAAILEAMRTSKAAEEVRAVPADGGLVPAVAFGIAARTALSRDDATALARLAMEVFDRLASDTPEHSLDGEVGRPAGELSE